MAKSTVTINGRTYVGNSVSVRNNKVYVDGEPVDDSEPSENGILEVEITGDVSLVECDESVKVYGNVEGDVDAGGSIKCGSVGGRVSSGGSVKCDDIGGDVSSGGSVKCSSIRGSVVAGGSVKGV